MAQKYEYKIIVVNRENGESINLLSAALRDNAALDWEPIHIEQRSMCSHHHYFLGWMVIFKRIKKGI